jgi:hypothetical protein
MILAVVLGLWVSVVPVALVVWSTHHIKPPRPIRYRRGEVIVTLVVDTSGLEAAFARVGQAMGAFAAPMNEAALAAERFRRAWMVDAPTEP